MSKVICELCGTFYPDTESKCPTCGTEKPVTADFMEDMDAEAPAAGRAHAPVKGGRFSKSNVKKRGSSTAAKKAEAPRPKAGKKRQKSDTPLIVAIVVLLLAIIAVMGYIYFNYLAPGNKEPSEPAQTTTEQTQEQTQQTTQDTTPPTTTEPEDLSCTDLKLSETSITFNKVGNGWLLNVIPTPANTTDTVTFVSSDESVATVSPEGKVTAVAAGEAVITITCGDVSIECKVVCDITPPETQPTTQPTTQPETKPAETDFQLNRSDITFSSYGESWKLYNGDIPLNEITWTVGNSAVATVSNGIVKAVGEGMTTVYAEYNGTKVSCIIRCSFAD